MHPRHIVLKSSSKMFLEKFFFPEVNFPTGSSTKWVLSKCIPPKCTIVQSVSLRHAEIITCYLWFYSTITFCNKQTHQHHALRISFLTCATYFWAIIILDGEGGFILLLLLSSEYKEWPSLRMTLHHGYYTKTGPVA